MINKPDPKLIGAFAAGAILLIVTMVVFFSSNQLLRRSLRYVLFFDQSVQGLSVGSAVKLRGVPIGTVREIVIRIEGQQEGSTAIPVMVQIDHDRIMNRLGGTNAARDLEDVETILAQLLIGRMEIESLITGQLFVELSFNPDFNPSDPPGKVGGLLVIPTEVSSIDKITSDIAEVIRGLNDIDVARLNENVNRVLENLAVTSDELTEVLEGIDSEGMSKSVITAAETIDTFVRSAEFTSTVVSVRRAFEEVGDLADALNTRKGPLGESVARIDEKLGAAVDNLNLLVANANSLVQPSSDFRYQVESVLRELAAAAAALRRTAEFIEDNPRALLTGRDDNKAAE